MWSHTVFNEGGNVRAAYDAVADVFGQMSERYDLRSSLIIDNHSTDDTFAGDQPRLPLSTPASAPSDLRAISDSIGRC